MRWTLWLILMALMGIFYEVADKEAEIELVAILGMSAVMLFTDYLKKRKTR